MRHVTHSIAARSSRPTRPRCSFRNGLARLGFPATVDMADWLIRAINALN
jgi:hypothetical protein